MAIGIGGIGQALVDEGLITKEQLAAALAQQQAQGGSLGFHLALLGYLSEEEVARFVAMQNAMEYVDLQTTQVDPEALKLVSEATAQRLTILPVARKPNGLVVAVVEPGTDAQDTLAKEIKFKTGLNLEYVIAPESYIKLLIEHYYNQLKAMGIVATDGGSVSPASPAAGAASSAPAEAKDTASSYAAKTPPPQPALDMSAIMEKASEEAELTMVDEKKSDDDFAAEGSPDDSLVIKMCNTMIAEAVKKKASDIHVEPFEKELLVRFRIDGALRAQPAPPVSFKRAIVARFKVMAKLNIMERRKPQDGRIKIMVAGRKIDLRVATCPVQWGEKVVMRILDQENLQTDLNKLGFEPEDLERFKEAIFQPYGIVLVTGPTGSGKTVTLYSALSTVNDPELNIMTAEDPIEYNLPMINQVPVNPDIGMTFEAALKSFLRCDPDIILVGEIRDLGTGSIAIKAAMTGHMVLSTMHTNDAPSAVNRMVDMGIDPFYIGTAVKAIVAQRLMRKLCVNCREPYTPTQAELDAMRVPPGFFDGVQIYRKRKGGCEVCNGTGNKGRTAIYEVMPFTESIIKLVFENATSQVLKAKAVEEGMNTLRVSALKKVRQGLCDLEGVAEMTAAD
jgi:type IV pilus assembly protein PilB